MTAANTYGRQVTEALANKSGGGVVAGDVVIIDTGNDGAFTTTTTGSYTGMVGIAQDTIANDATGRILTAGYAALVNVNASVTRGHFGTTYTTVKQATDGGASRTNGTFCQFLTGGTTPTAHVFGMPDGSSAAGGITHSTLGTTTVGGSSQTGRGTYAKSITLATDGFLAAIVAHIKGNGSNDDSAFAALYDDSSGPQNLLFCSPGRITTTPVAVTAQRMNTTFRWVRFPVGAWLPAATYWIAVQLSQGNMTLAYDSGSNVDRFQNNVLATTNSAMDASLSSFAAAANNYSIYADILR